MDLSSIVALSTFSVYSRTSDRVIHIVFVSHYTLSGAFMSVNVSGSHSVHRRLVLSEAVGFVHMCHSQRREMRPPLYVLLCVTHSECPQGH